MFAVFLSPKFDKALLRGLRGWVFDGLMSDVQYHSCALSSSGGVSCWGRNGNGEVMPVVCVKSFFVFAGASAYRADDCVCFRAGCRRYHDLSKDACSCLLFFNCSCP